MSSYLFNTFWSHCRWHRGPTLISSLGEVVWQYIKKGEGSVVGRADVLESLLDDLASYNFLSGKDFVVNGLNVVELVTSHPALSLAKLTRQLTDAEGVRKLRLQWARRRVAADMLIGETGRQVFPVFSNAGCLPETLWYIIPLTVARFIPTAAALYYTDRFGLLALEAADFAMTLSHPRTVQADNVASNQLVRLRPDNYKLQQFTHILQCDYCDPLLTPQQRLLLLQLYSWGIDLAVRKNDFAAIVAATPVYVKDNMVMLTPNRIPAQVCTALLIMRFNALLKLGNIGKAKQLLQQVNDSLKHLSPYHQAGLAKVYYQLAAVFSELAQQDIFTAFYHRRLQQRCEAQHAAMQSYVVRDALSYLLSLPLQFSIAQAMPLLEYFLPNRRLPTPEQQQQSELDDIKWQPTDQKAYQVRPPVPYAIKDFMMVNTLGDGDCFFHAVGHPQLTRESLVAKLLEHASDSDVRAAFSVDIMQFMMIGFTAQHESPTEQAAYQALAAIHSLLIDLFTLKNQLEEPLNIITRRAKEALLAHVLEAKLQNLDHQQICELLSRYDTLSSLYNQFSELLQRQHAIQYNIYAACQSEALFRDYVITYYAQVKGFVALSRDFNGFNDKSTIDIINQLFGLNIHVLTPAARGSKQLTLLNQPPHLYAQNSRYILHDGAQHFSTLVHDQQYWMLRNILSQRFGSKTHRRSITKSLPKPAATLFTRLTAEIIAELDNPVETPNLTTGLACYLLALDVKYDEALFNRYLARAKHYGYTPDLEADIALMLKHHPHFAIYQSVLNLFNFNSRQKVQFLSLVLYNKTRLFFSDRYTALTVRRKLCNLAREAICQDNDVMTELNNKLAQLVHDDLPYDHVKQYLAQGASPDVVTEFHSYGQHISDALPQSYLLFNAAIRNRLDIILLLTDYGVNPDSVNHYRMNVLECYFDNPHVRPDDQIIAVLLALGIDPDSTLSGPLSVLPSHNFGNKISNVIGLMLFGSMNLAVAKTPLSRVLPDRDQYAGWSARDIAKHKSISFGHRPRLVRQAILEANTERALELFALETFLSAPEFKYATPLMLVVDLMRENIHGDGGRWVHIARYLLDNPNHVNATNHNGETALMHAVRHRSENLVWLLNLGLSQIINYCDDSGRTALMIAVEINDADAVRILLHYGADSNIMMKYDPSTYVIGSGYVQDDISPLMLSVIRNFVEITRLLLSNYSLDVNQKAKSGKTAFWYALENDTFGFFSGYRAEERRLLSEKGAVKGEVLLTREIPHRTLGLDYRPEL